MEASCQRQRQRNVTAVIWYIFLGILSTTTRLLRAESFEEQLKLHEYLEAQSHKDIRPIHNQSNAIDVEVQFSVLSVQELDEKTQFDEGLLYDKKFVQSQLLVLQVLSSTVGIVMTWMCETLAWNESDYGGARLARLTASETWLPDIALYNSIDNNQILNMEDEGAFKVSLRYDGRAVWSSGGNFDTNCKVDITNYPFDTQICEFILGKYFSSDGVLNLVPVKTNVVQMPIFVTNDVWDIQRTGISKLPMSPNYSKIVVQLTLQRRPLFYILNVILPVGILSFMNVLSFKLPVTSGERVGFCVSLFLTFMVLLDAISDSMPKVSQSVSFLQMYVNTQLIMGMVITAISIVLVKISVNWSDEHVPSWVQALHRITRKYRRMNTVARVDYNGLQDAEIVEESSPASEAVRICRENSKSSSAASTKPSDPRETIKNLDQVFFIVFLCLWLLINVLFVVCMLTYETK